MKSLAELNKLRVALFVSIFAFVAAVVIFKADAAPKSGQTSAGSTTGVNLYVSPSSQKVAAGSSVNLQVWVDTKDQNVNAVQANLVYPSDKFNFNKIDATGSAFEIEAQSTGNNGNITIARGHVGDLKGVQLVATVTLVAKSSGKANVSFSNTSAVISSVSHANVLQSTTGGRFTLGSLMSGGLSSQVFMLNQKILSKF
jgi:hypothetical protein